MAVDRLGNAVATGQVYALAGTARFVDGDDVVPVSPSELQLGDVVVVRPGGRAARRNG